MSVTPTIEVVIAVCNPDGALADTISSLINQTERTFTVLISDNFSVEGLRWIETALENLSAAGIVTRRISPSTPLGAIEHWNDAFARASAEWLKPLCAGDQIKPDYIKFLSHRIAVSPQSRMIRCDLELQTDWGNERLAAPFNQAALNRSQVMEYFPAHFEWLSRCANFAYHRAAWLALGGFSPHTPALSTLQFNVLLALHYGMENLPVSLASARFHDGFSLNATGPTRVNFTLEFWLILRQVKNYCLANKLPWKARCPFWRAVIASLKRS